MAADFSEAGRNPPKTTIGLIRRGGTSSPGVPGPGEPAASAVGCLASSPFFSHKARGATGGEL